MIWLVGQWVGVKLSASLRPVLYQAILPLLEKGQDLVVRLEAANTLKLDILRLLQNRSIRLGPNHFLGSHRLEKYLNLKAFLEKSLKFKSVLKSTGESLKSLENSLNSTVFCMN